MFNAGFLVLGFQKSFLNVIVGV